MVTPEKLRCFGTFYGVNSNFCCRHSQNYIQEFMNHEKVV